MAAGNFTTGSKGPFHIRTHPAPGCQLGCGIAGKENKVFVACYTRHAFSRQARLRDQNIGDRQPVVDVLARADLINQIAFELATESSAFAADVVHGAASVENWGTCRFARERWVGEADALSRACGFRPR
jgi:hypothetical protein